MELPEILTDDSSKETITELKETNSVVAPESPISEQLDSVAQDNSAALQEVSEDENLSNILKTDDLQDAQLSQEARSDINDIPESERITYGNVAQNLDACEQKMCLDLYNIEHGTNLVFSDEHINPITSIARNQLAAIGAFNGIEGDTEQELATNTILSFAKAYNEVAAMPEEERERLKAKAIDDIKRGAKETAEDVALSFPTGAAKVAKSVSDFYLPESLEMQEPTYEPKTTVGKISEGIGSLATAAAMIKPLGLKYGMLLGKRFVTSPLAMSLAKATIKFTSGYLTQGLAFMRDEGNMSNILKETNIPLVKDVASFLAINKDDSEAEKFFKQGIEGVVNEKLADFLLSSFRMLRHAKKTANEIDDVVKHNTVIKKEVQTTAKEATKAAPVGDAVTPLAKKEVAKIATKKENVRDAFSKYAEKWGINIPRAAKANEGEIYESAAKRLEKSGYALIENAEERVAKAKELVAKDKDIVSRSATAANILDMEWNAAREKYNKAFALHQAKSLTPEQLDDVFWDCIERMEKFDGLLKDAVSPGAQALNIASKSEANRFINSMRDIWSKDETSARLLESAIMSGRSGEEIMWAWDWAKKLTGTNTIKDSYRKLVFMRQSYLLSKPSTHVKNILGNVEEIGKNQFVNPVASMIGMGRRSLKLGQFDDYMTMNDTANYAKNITTSAISYFSHVLKPTKEMKYIYHDLGKIAEDTPEELFKSKMFKAFAKYGPLKQLTNEDMIFQAANFKASLEEYLSRTMRKTGLNEIDGKTAAKFIENKILSPNSGEELSGLLRPIKERAITKSAIAYARDKAAYNTFKTGFSEATQVTSKIMNWPIFKLFFTPFAQTRASMIFDHLIRDDIGAMFGKGWVTKFGGQKWGAEADKALAKGLLVGSVGWPLMLGLTSLALNGHITGGKYKNQKKEKEFIENGGQHYSFVWPKNGGKKAYVSINDTGVISDLLCLAGDIAQAQEEFSDREDLGKVFEDPSVVDYVVEAGKRLGIFALKEVGLRGLGDIFEIYSNMEENDDRAISKLTTIATDTLVPSVLQGIGKEKWGYGDRYKKERPRTFYEMVAKKLGVVEAVGKKIGKEPRYAYSNTGELIESDDTLLKLTTGLKYKEQSEVEAIKEKGNIVFPKINSVRISSDISVPLSPDENYRLRKIMNATGAYKRINAAIMAQKDIIKLDDVKNGIIGLYNQEVEAATAILLEEMPEIATRGIQTSIESVQKQFE